MNEPTCRAVVGGTQGDPGGTLSYCGQPESARIHSKQFVETVGHAFVGPTPDLEAAFERHFEAMAALLDPEAPATLPDQDRNEP